MKIIISPAKKMQFNDDFEVLSQPEFLDESRQLMKYLKTLNQTQLQAIWRCSDRLAQENYQRIKDFSFEKQLSPAVFTYVGLQFQFLAADVFTQDKLDYLKEHLFIVSGLYGLLRPFDGINLYRLEMQAKLPGFSSPNLYDFWGAKLYQALFEEQQPVLNLASKEYSQAISPYLQANDQFISCVFAKKQVQTGKLVVRATAAKQARGDMVSYLAEVQAQDLAAVRGYQRLGYVYSEVDSRPNKLVFIQE